MNAPGGPIQGQELAVVLSYLILPVVLSAPSRQDHVPPMPIGHQRWSAQAEIRQKRVIRRPPYPYKSNIQNLLTMYGKAKAV